MRRHRSRLELIFLLLITACAGKEGGDSNAGGAGGGAGAAGSGTAGSASGTGLPSGTFCVRVGSGHEHCSASGNKASRTLNDSQISIYVSHESSVPCEAGCSTCADPAAASVHFVIPDGLPFPYQKTGTQSGVFGSHLLNDGACVWDNGSTDFPMSGTVYRAGTNGATHLEADLSMQTVDAICLPTADGCPNVTAQLRFNLPL